MKTWTWVLLLIIVYLIGVKFPGPGNSALGVIGL